MSSMALYAKRLCNLYYYPFFELYFHINFLSHCFREYMQYGSWGMLFFHSNSITVTNPSWVAGALFMAWFFSANPLAGIEEMWKYYSGWRHFNLTFIMWQWLLAIDTTRKSIFDQFYNYAAINLYFTEGFDLFYIIVKQNYTVSGSKKRKIISTHPETRIVSSCPLIFFLFARKPAIATVLQMRSEQERCQRVWGLLCEYFRGFSAARTAVEEFQTLCQHWALSCMSAAAGTSIVHCDIMIVKSQRGCYVAH